jgi:hypothetical protein
MPEIRNEIPYRISKIEQPLMEQPYFAKREPPMGAKPKPRALHVDIYLADSVSVNLFDQGFESNSGSLPLKFRFHLQRQCPTITHAQ